MKLIAFSGKAQAGKTTSALHCIETFGGTKIALGDAVKEEVRDFIISCGVACDDCNLWGSAADRAELLILNVSQWSRSDYRPRRILTKYIEWASPTQVQISYRQLLQVWGTEYRRAQREDYWCEVGKQKILSTDGKVFIDDIRFPDEVEMIKNMGGIVIRIERPGDARIATPDHPSETSLDGYKGFDAHIINAGDVTDLQENVERLLRLVL